MTDLIPLRGRSAWMAPALAVALALEATMSWSQAVTQPVPPRTTFNTSSAAPSAPPRTGDYILAVVNQELVTAGEVEQRMARARAAARGAGLPPENVLRQQVLDALINERVMVTHARTSGQRIDEAELDRAVANVAQQNQLSLPQLRERLRQEGLDYARFRNNLRDQMLTERVREREVQARLRITDADVEDWLESQRAQQAGRVSYNIAQILVSVPEGASEATVAERRARAEQVIARLSAGEPFDKLAAEMSDDAQTRDAGGQLGMRSADRLPELFVNAVKDLQAGQRLAAPLRSPAGFHVLQVVERSDAQGFSVTQTRARHILLRPSPQLPPEAAARRLSELKRQIEAGTASFEQLARQNSEDGSAAAGGDLGWTSPGNFVPEFEEAMNALRVGGLSEPVASRFGLHLIQVTDRRQVALDNRQQRELARGALRAQKFDQAYADWLGELRARAYIEMREAP